MFKDTNDFIQRYREAMIEKYGKEFEQSNHLERYQTLAEMIASEAKNIEHTTNERYRKEKRRRVYYFSMEFLIGRLLYNYLMNLGDVEIVQEGLEQMGGDLSVLLEQERDPGLGNGGLGRLAACFMDSMAYLGVPGYGHGIHYRFGLFKQKIVHGYQTELPDEWLKYGYPWETYRPENAVVVRYGGEVIRSYEAGRYWYTWEPEQEILAVPYDVPIIGYQGKNVHKICLWSAKPCVEKFDMDAFNHGDYSGAVREQAEVEALTYLLYPSDESESGKTLRLKQEYFFVAAGISDILRHYCQEFGHQNWEQFPQKVAIHINDTHPALCSVEFIRILLDEEGLTWEEAWDITTRTFSYTNHTILPEALEEWPIDLLRRVLPRHYMIIEEIDRRYREAFRRNLNNWQEVLAQTSILWDGRVRMANLSVVSSYSVNGVAQLHTQILQERVLHGFYLLHPQKFNNKTNGVAHRRFLREANPALSALITEAIGPDWMGDARLLQNLKPFIQDAAFLEKLSQVKKTNKKRLADFIWKNAGIHVDPESIFDVQVKRFHAYKRQLLNIFKVMDVYNRLLEGSIGNLPPQTFIFAGKAAQGYRFAKSVIKLINSVAEMINHDPRVNEILRVAFIEDFNVSKAQLIYPAADISEQISTAGMEASGTGNMKFMYQGAITLGTLDGANVEIQQAVGKENLRIFGLTAEEIAEFHKNNSYMAWDVYQADSRLKQVVDQLVNGFLSGSGEVFWEIQDSLLRYNDEFFVLKDFQPYIQAWEELVRLYQQEPQKWWRTSLENIAAAGIFSSDRSIMQYEKEIWKTAEKVVK